ncbi:MAG: tRNA (adenosine(37)-N6)-threonylcarbamoyltransferase complex dimerization subunit type 1 TsaB [Waddliaceae bacterium]
MTLLIIDTATERAIVAIIKDGTLLSKKELPFGLKSSEHLLPILESETLGQGVDVQTDLEGIIVGIGPGSYTGTRVGVMAAKAISYATSTPLVGIPTLAALLNEDEPTCASMIDAKSQGVYLMRPGGSPILVPIEKIDDALDGVKTIVTPNLSGVQFKVTREVEWVESAPNPMRLASLGLSKLSAGEYSINGELDILYLR